MSLSNDVEQKLIQAAIHARGHAHCPYSRFAVGAALIDTQGAIHVGCNVENASFAATICAERAALVSAIAQGATTFTSLVIVTSGGGPPCGICRQTLAEFCEELDLLLVDANGTVPPVRRTLSQLLPDPFSLRR